MPAVGVRLCWPHIPAGREGRAGGGLGREGGGSATALRAPKSQRSVQGGRAPGELLPIPEQRCLPNHAGPMTAVGRRFPILGQGR